MAKQLRKKVCIPKSHIIVHPCLCAFQALSNPILQFPEAFEDYAKKCKELDPNFDARRPSLVGTCIIKEVEYSKLQPGSRIHIGSLMTSLDYGKRVDSPKTILKNTRKALKSLKDQIPKINADNAKNGITPEIWAVRFNGGLFKVPWEETRAILEQVLGEGGERLENNIRIIYPPENAVKKPRKQSRKENQRLDTNYNLATPDFNDPIPADSDSTFTTPVDSRSTSTSPETRYAGSLRPLKRKMASNKTLRSTPRKRMVRPGRNKKPKDRERQGGSPSKIQVEQGIIQGKRVVSQGSP